MTIPCRWLPLLYDMCLHARSYRSTRLNLFIQLCGFRSVCTELCGKLVITSENTTIVKDVMKLQDSSTSSKNENVINCRKAMPSTPDRDKVRYDTEIKKPRQDTAIWMVVLTRK